MMTSPRLATPRHRRALDRWGVAANNFVIPRMVVDTKLALYNLTILGWSEFGMDGNQAVQALGALAHDTRLALFRMLVERGPDGLSAGIIAERLQIPPSSLTFHIQHLHRAGLISQRRVSRQLIYAADFSAMNGLIGFLTENCCGRGANICMPAKTGS